MAQKATDKAKRTTARGGKTSTAAPAESRAGEPRADANPAGRVAELEAERDRLAAELAAAKERIAKLEEARAQAVNRIDWIIDSLHNLIDEEN